MPSAPCTTQLYRHASASRPHAARRYHSLRVSPALHPPERPPPLATSLLGHASQHALPRRLGERRSVSIVCIICAALAFGRRRYLIVHAAHRHLSTQRLIKSFYASVRAGHVAGDALECLHLVRGETAASTASAEDQQCPAVLKTKTGQSGEGVVSERGTLEDGGPAPRIPHVSGFWHPVPSSFVRASRNANNCLPSMQWPAGNDTTLLLIARPQTCFPIISIFSAPSGAFRSKPPTRSSRVWNTLANWIWSFILSYQDEIRHNYVRRGGCRATDRQYKETSSTG